MDDLKAEILRKRKEREGDLTTKPSKYLRRGELEKLKQAEKERTASASPAPPASQTPPISTSSPKPDTTSTSTPAGGETASSPAPPAAAGSSKQEGFNISNEDAVRRLRAKGQPIRLFDESDRDRRLRLRALELLEERGDGNKGAGLNDFRRVMEHMEKGLNVEDAVQRLLNKGQGGANAEGKEGDVKAVIAAAKDDEEQVIDLGLLQTDPDRLYPLIYYAIKRKLKEWEQYMADRPDSIKHSVQGKRAAATQVQSGEYLKPLFKLLRQRNLPPDVLRRIGEIIYYMQQREYQKANDSYLRLSIGNAPWPIGVTMVGIHERSAREKISTDQVAHVLNDEVSRKYIQSLKRLLTFAQTKYPPADISQLMG